jgi:hypothetical protein
LENNKIMVSVIITNYKYEKYILQAIKSAHNACANANVSYEVIVVTDDPESSFDYGFKNEKNMGVSYSRNRGIKESKGEFIVILDGDDMLTRGSVLCQLEAFEKRPDLLMVHGPVYRFEGNADLKTCEMAEKDGILKKHPSLITCQGMMVRREIFELYGLYFEGLRSAEDKELLYRWGMHRNSPITRSFVAEKIKCPTAYYRRHPGSKRKTRKYDLNFDINTMMQFDGRVMQMVQHGVTAGVELLPVRENG